MQPISELVAPLGKRGYHPLARLRPRHSREIAGSPWSIGLEAIDRDYAAPFSQSGPHLGELGAKQARVQAGWARCEPRPGQPYEWAWLDEIVDGCVAQGVTPWLQTSYGNPGYPGGGGVGLAQGWPTSPEALAAWDRWVRALVERYRDRVHTWEIWNEPDHHASSTPEDYAGFLARTAAIVRGAQPGARIVGFAIAWHDEKNRVGRALAALAAAGHAHLLDEFSFHFYPHNPDDHFDVAADIARLLRRHAPHVTLRQGETGAPSECVRFMALGEELWNERKQAAWDLRRLLAHHARGIPMNLFQLSDMYYEPRDGALFSGYNPKGLLRIRPDRSVAYRKPSYFAAQHVFGLFDDRFPLRALPPVASRAPFRVAAHVWKQGNDAAPAILGWWRSDQAPGLLAPHPDAVYPIGFEPIRFRDPVLVDFLSGVVFTPPEGIASGDEGVWAALPCAETPLAFVERELLALRPL